MRTLLKRSGNELMFWCPGCECAHSFDMGRNIWTFNGNYEAPTFTPSLLYRGGKDERIICHLIVTSGRIQFCADCPHSLVGQNVAMVPWEKILGGEMDEQNQQQQDAGKTDPTAAPAPLQPATQPDPTVTTANVNEALRKMAPTPIDQPPAATNSPAEVPDLSKMAGGPSVPPPNPANNEAVDPRREEAIEYVMSHGNTRQQAEKTVAELGIGHILSHKSGLLAGVADEDEDNVKDEGEVEEEVLPDGAEHLKKCTACGTWHSKGELVCPQCGTAFPGVRG